MRFHVMTSVKATLLSAKLIGHIVDREVKAKIHSRFKNAINIALEDGYLFNILPEIIPPNSRSLVLPLREWRLIQGLVPVYGTPVLIRESRMEIPALAVKITFSPTKLWDPTPSLSGPPITTSKIRRNLEMVSEIVAHSADPEISTKILLIEPHKLLEKIPHKAICETSRDAFLRTACEAIRELLVSMWNLDFQGVTKASYRLIGLGPGLTPSGDDILAGVMATGSYFSLAYKGLRSEVKRINSCIISKVPGRTTVLSQILLSDANKGEVARPLGQLLQEILCGVEAPLIADLSHQVMALGASSGRDTLVGVVTGFEAFLRLEERMHRTSSSGR